MQSDTARERRIMIGAAASSLAVGALIMSIKFLAYSLTGSSAILSDALESIINVLAGGFALLSVIYASMPPDKAHPYGHGVIEYFSAGFEGALILLAAVGIVWESYGRILNPVPLSRLDAGLWLLLGSSAANMALGLILTRVGRRTGSLTLVADGRHVMTDVITSAGVLAGLFLVKLTGWLWLDGAVACAVAASIALTGVDLLRQAAAGIMRRSDPDLLGAICEEIEARRAPEWIGVHRLRAWRSGRMLHADLHLILPRDMPLHAAHDHVQALEDALMARFGPEADILIHADPCDNGKCPACDADPCDLRDAPHVTRPVFSVETVVEDDPQAR